MAFSVQAYLSNPAVLTGGTTDLVITYTGDGNLTDRGSNFLIQTQLEFVQVVSASPSLTVSSDGTTVDIFSMSGSPRNGASFTLKLRYKAKASQLGGIPIKVTVNSQNSALAIYSSVQAPYLELFVASSPENLPPEQATLTLAARTDVVPDRFLKAKGTWQKPASTYSYVEVRTYLEDGVTSAQSNYNLVNQGTAASPYSLDFYFPDFETVYKVQIRFVRESPAAAGAWSSLVTWTTENEIALGNASSLSASASIDQPEIRLQVTVPRVVLPTTDPRYNLYFSSANIYRASTALGSYTKIASNVSASGNLGSTVVYTDTTTDFDTEYFYKAKACLPGAPTIETAFTSVASATTIPPPGPPDAPTLTATTDSYRQISLEWQEFSSITSFEVRRGLAAGGPFVHVADVPAGSTEYSDTGLDPSTTYYYKVTAKNPYGSTESNVANATTSVAPDAPPPPTNLSGSALNANKVRLTWTAGVLPATVNPSGNSPEYFDVRRSTDEGGPYDTVASVAPDQTQYVDGSVAANETYYYVVRARNAGGNSADSNEVEVTTPDRSVTLLQDLSFTFTVGAATRIIQVAGYLMFWSSLDRCVTWVNRRSFLGGLKRQLVAPAVAAGSATGLTGRFKAFIMLHRTDGQTPSRPSPESLEIELTDEKLVITPQVDPADPTKIYVRDIGYDASGDQIDGCDFYDIYIWDLDGSQGYPNYVDTVPITTLSYTTAADFTTTELARGKQMPDFENMIPPACGTAIYAPAISRVLATGEDTIKPTADETTAGAQLNITQGNTYCTLTNWTPTDALMHKQLRLNRATTNWFVEDIEADAVPPKLHLRNPDFKKNEDGFAGANGPYSDFAFSGNPSRIYLSAFFTASDTETAFQPQTFPPRYLEGELNPDDNQNPNAMLPSRDVILTTKPNSCFHLIGGRGPDEDPFTGLPQVVNLSGGSGLLAPKTFCKDRHDVAYGLNDQGPFRLDQSGPQNVGLNAGVAWLLQRYYDIGTATDACGCHFPREDYFIVCGLNCKGRTGNRDWFIYDTRNNAVLMQTFPSRITALLPTPTDSGEMQLLYGDENGNLGTLLTIGSHIDGTDFTRSNPADGETPIQCSVTTGVVSPTYGFSPELFRPHIKIENQTESVQFVIEYDSMNRSGDASAEFVASKSKSFTIRTDRNPDHVNLPRKECQSARFRLRFTSPRASQVRIANMEVEALEHGA